MGFAFQTKVDDNKYISRLILFFPPRLAFATCYHRDSRKPVKLKKIIPYPNTTNPVKIGHPIK